MPAISGYNTYQTLYLCVGCDSSYNNLENLKTHFTTHTPKIDENSSLIEHEQLKQFINISDVPVESSKLSTTTVNNAIFNFNSEYESKIATHVLKNHKWQSTHHYAIEEGFKKSGMVQNLDILSLQENMNIISQIGNDGPLEVKLKACEGTNASSTKTKSVSGGDYLYHYLNNSEYESLLKYESYKEITFGTVSMLNMDRKIYPFYRIACGKPSLDLHYERFGSAYNQSSLPAFSNRYIKVNVTKRLEDKSEKLIIGTIIFNDLVTSSLRLDTNNVSPELGASTYNFQPTKATKMYVSRKSIEAANKAIVEENTCFIHHDYDAQLRQVRSYFTSPKTYTANRCSSEWTDNLLCRPYTIFTLVDKSGNEGSNYVTASKMLLKVADSIRYKRGILKKEDVLELMTKKENASSVEKLLRQILSVFPDESDEVYIINNADIEVPLVALANITTMKLFFIHCVGQIFKINCTFLKTFFYLK